ncbi:MAG: hypothetical protein ABUT39_22880 [Acidobacteriota bacterium]
MAENKERKLRGPVGWLLDRQLFINLREILLYSAFGARIDPRNWMVGREVDLTRGFHGEEFWFDYLSDTGDSMLATYSIAYLVCSDVWASSATGPGAASLEPDGDLPRRLPRGAFLMIGGDTAYHVADYETLAERFHFPFNRAFEHLAKLGKVDPDERRPLFGIPGNHDYYDFLDGFNRQFRRPYNDERRYDASAGGDQPQLVLEGFRRKQWASYFSLELPFGWRLWGMDAQGGSMDRRQKNFFRTIRNDPGKPTDRLIVATPEPITAFGRRADGDGEIAHTLKDIGLPLPFLEEDPETALPAGSCRLDLAGDVHHYARYWGSEPGAERPASYASVVSGLGGAFLHSTSTDVGEVSARVRYPRATTALSETLRRVLEPWSIAKGGRVWGIGLLVAGLLYIAASSAPSLQSAVEPAMRKADLDFPRPPATATWDPVVKAIQALQTSLDVDRTSRDEEKIRLQPLRWLDWELAYLLVLLPLLAGATIRNGRLAARQRRGETVPDSAYNRPIWLLAAASLATVVWIYALPWDAYGTLRPLTCDFVVLAMLAVGFLGLWWCRQYDDVLNVKARRTGLTRQDQAQSLVLWTFTGLAGLFGVTRYGYYSLAVAAVDIAFLVVVLGILAGLPVFAWKVGGELHGLPGKVGFLLLGLAHAALQLSVPVVLVVSSGPLFGGAAALATVGFTWLVSRTAPRLLRRSGAEGRRLLGALLLALWLAWGGGLLAVAWWQRTTQSVNASSFLLALFLGAVFSCTWLGWYLAVSLCFDGHNNEAGGGARIERFKQIIRFRLTVEGLTGYVIAIDEPKADGSKLEPRVIDVFEVRPEPESPGTDRRPADEPLNKAF